MYLRWLSERVLVESPFVAFAATQSLTAAALRLSAGEMVRVRQVSKAAIERLNWLAEEEDIARELSAEARKHQLETAVSIGELRTTKAGSIIAPMKPTSSWLRY